MRLLHTSDLHLGRRLYGVDLLAHQAHFLDWLLATARDRQVDAVLVSGDVYDRSAPSAEAVALLDRTLAAFVGAGVPLILSSGNHDSAARLQYGGVVMAAAGIHLRTSLAESVVPVVLSDEHGPVGVYGLPFLLPDAVCAELGVERSHEAVLRAAVHRIRADAAERGLARTVVMSHSFVTGGVVSESERDLRVGGVGDVPAGVFDGATYVALGHLHGPQEVRLHGSDTVLQYSGSPLAFSFSEVGHTKSVTLVELDALGVVGVQRIPTPVPRPLREVRGLLEDLLRRAHEDLAELSEAWVKVVLTDSGRVAHAMDRLRAVWPHVLVLVFDPAGSDTAVPVPRAGDSLDPGEICARFLATVSGSPMTGQQGAIVQAAIAQCRADEAAA
jgi:DNA repair protein SbcD/Mre11